MKILYFHSAPWCGSCKILKPLAEKICTELGVTFEEVKTEERAPIIPNILGVPTVVVAESAWDDGRAAQITSILAPDLVNARTLRKALA